MSNSQIIKHCLRADDLDAVSVLSAHKRPSVRIFIQSGVCQIHVCLVLLTAFSVDVHVHILHAEILTVAVPETFIGFQIPFQECLVYLSGGIAVAVEYDEML